MGLGNSSEMRVKRRPGRLSNPERQVPGFPPHSDHEIPARRRLRVDHQVLDNLDTVVPRRLVPERVDVGRQIQVVVDCLRYVHDVDASCGMLFELHGRERGVVSADRDELRHVQPQQRNDGVLQVSRVGGRVRPRDAEVGAAPEMDPAHGVDVERDHMIDVALHDPLEAVAEPDDVNPFEPGADGRRADDAVDPWGGASTDQDREILMVLHRSTSIVTGPWCKNVEPRVRRRGCPEFRDRFVGNHCICFRVRSQVIASRPPASDRRSIPHDCRAPPT